MINLEQAKQDIEHWIVNFCEVPHPALGGFPPCPYAKKARLERDFEIRLGMDPYFDLKTLPSMGLSKSVLIYVYDPKEWSHEQLAASISAANNEVLVKNDILALEDHPDDPEWVNGICMNQGTYAMAMCQSLSDLNAKARLVARKGFYDAWPEEYLTSLFQYREDPRK